MTVRDTSTAVPHTCASATEARLESHNLWQAGGKDVVPETVSVPVFPAKAARELDVAPTWEAIADPVTLRGSAEPGKSYGGFSPRFAPATPRFCVRVAKF